MTTVVDPLVAPFVIYNRAGTAIVSIVGGATASSTVGSGFGDDANPIPRVCQTTIVLVTTSYDGSHHLVLARLPNDAEVGDVVEVYKDAASSGSNPVVFPNAGESIGSNPVSTGTNPTAGVSVPEMGGIVFRKVSSSLWMPIGAV